MIYELLQRILVCGPLFMTKESPRISISLETSYAHYRKPSSADQEVKMHRPRQNETPRRKTKTKKSNIADIYIYRLDDALVGCLKLSRRQTRAPASRKMSHVPAKVTGLKKYLTFLRSALAVGRVVTRPPHTRFAHPIEDRSLRTTGSKWYWRVASGGAWCVDRRRYVAGELVRQMRWGDARGAKAAQKAGGRGTINCGGEGGRQHNREGGFTTAYTTLRYASRSSTEGTGWRK